MSNPAWPIDDDFPQNILIDDTYQLNDNTLADEMEVGPDFLRLRDTVSYGTYTAGFLMTANHRAMMIDFYRNTTRGGTIPFLWKDPVTQVEGLFRFRAAPAFAPLGDWFRCGVVIEEVPS